MKEGIIYIYYNYHYNDKEYQRLSDIEHPINRLRKIHSYVKDNKIIYYSNCDHSHEKAFGFEIKRVIK